MSSTLLANELTNLASEAKRKNNELRNAADKSLQELKALPSTSEQQLAADLSRRPTFIDPFVIACGTRNTRFAGSGVTCLQRLIISRGLPRARLQDALEAFNACTDLGLEIQLKILQALPSLLQNYAEDLKGDLLRGALEVCSSLHSAKVPTVSGVAAATLQQLVSTVFEKVASEDRNADDVQALNEVVLDDGEIKLRPAAYDAYRVFRDLSLAAEERKTKFVQFASLSQESILELIRSCIHSNPQLFTSHVELGSVIRSNILPLVTHALSEKLSFPVTLRSFRILDLVLGRYIAHFPADCVLPLDLVTRLLDADAAPPWKRAMSMELLRNFFADGARIVDVYSAYDMGDNGKKIVQNLMSAFVRLSAEKPSVIGLGQQSTAPAGPNLDREQSEVKSPIETAGGVAGMISSALGVAEVNVAGISSRWSVPRTACLEQLDKLESPTIPETYIYALVLECMSSLSDGLAKVVLPLTVQHEKSKTKGQGSTNGASSDGQHAQGRDRSESFRKRTVPLNPLEQKLQEVPTRVQAVNSLVESCWPAFLATSSTFLNAALDDQYYRNLIKAYQRFTQVAGLLRLKTARDALMTTLGKAAVPPHILTSALSEQLKTPPADSPRVFSNPKALLSVDSLMSPPPSERERMRFTETSKFLLSTRNLLCLRALLNLAIALGPTLNTAFAVVVDTLRQADLVLSATSPQQMARQSLPASQKGSEAQNAVQAFMNEVTAVEAAASRLLESTADYPNDAFLNVLYTFCRLLHGKDPVTPSSPRPDPTSPPATPTQKSRTFSGLIGLNTMTEMQMRDYKFVIPKLGNLAELNVSRFASADPIETGWNVLIEELVTLASRNSTPNEARRAATGVLCKVAGEIIAEVMEDDVEKRITIQRRTLATLLRVIDGIYAEDGELTGSDIDVQGRVVEALQAILERCGESLVAGWNRTIGIISSVFERSGTPPDRQDDEETHIDWLNVSKDFVSIQLGRAAFAATQLICSDFLSALPTTVVPSLIELLYRFASQTDDLNISLSAITMAWNVSDFLLNALDEKDLDAMVSRIKEGDSFEEEVQSALRTSSVAQWFLLLLRLREIVGSGLKEVRKAAFQTICSIFKNNGSQLTSGTWDLTLRSIIMRICMNDALLYHSEQDDVAETEQSVPHDEAISSALITGSSEIMLQHLRLIEQISQLPSLWEAFLGRLEAYLDLEKTTINTAVYQALTKILSRINTGTKVWTGPMYRTLALWLKRNPATVEFDGKESNQDTLVAYVEAGSELYRLTRQSMSMSHIRTLVENLYLCIRHSDGPLYGADISTLSPLQAQAFQLLRTLQSDSPSTQIVVAAKMATLHHDTTSLNTSTNSGPTFIAVASEAIEWVQTLVLDNVKDEDLIETGIIVSVLESLRRIIEEKYRFKLEHQGLPLWRKATVVALALAEPILQQCQRPHLENTVKISIWTEFVQIANGIMHAKGLDLVTNGTQIYEDEIADLESFKALRQVLIPRVGDAQLPGSILNAYARSLFEASMIHSTEVGEVPPFGSSPFENIGKIRRGRVKKIRPSRRETMSYECFKELINLSSRTDGECSEERRRLAQAAAPLLILRLAIPIRAYIADQPLRGSIPQPLSERDELLFAFEVIGKLELESDASASEPAVAAQLTGGNAHLRYLYPLLVKAVGTAADRWSGADEVLKPLRAVLESVMPVT